MPLVRTYGLVCNRLFCKYVTPLIILAQFQAETGGTIHDKGNAALQAPHSRGRAILGQAAYPAS